MKKLIKNKKIYYIFITIIVILYIFMILKGGVGIVFQYETRFVDTHKGGILNLAPDVMPSAEGILIDNILIVIASIILLILDIIPSDKKSMKIAVLIILIILTLFFVPIITFIGYKDMNYDNEFAFIISTHLHYNNVSTLLDIFSIY